jgi:hypothetical protein
LINTTATLKDLGMRAELVEARIARRRGEEERGDMLTVHE